ncbi:MAG: riboflavin kinase [Patescibacteria group bacterium]
MIKKYIIIWGKVRRGSKRGKLLGFPTANFLIHKKIAQGVYISQTKFIGKIYKSATFIGNAKTFGEKDIKAETYILDFDKSIYGKFISVTLLKKLRENLMFKSERELTKQMDKDLEDTKKYFKDF